MRSSRLTNLSRTKTVATVGPASGKTEVLCEMIKAGVNVFRLNMAHGSREFHEEILTCVRQASENVQMPAAILVDLAGPKIRLGQLAEDPLRIETGQEVRFVRGQQSQTRDELTCTYEPLVDEVKTGDMIVLADGALRLQVTDSQADCLVCTASDGGVIRSRQGVNLPATELSVPALEEVDIDNANWACQQGVDFISISFVRNANEVRQLRDILESNQSNAHIVAKIEKREALNNLDDIVQATDVVMVARGDLGVEIEIEKTPLAQKRIINTCLKYSKPVIVATQMLESMHHSKQPTRAEVSDVANAILDGADACMLSGETAIGEFPLEAVRMMQKIKMETEATYENQDSKSSNLKSTDCPISEAVVYGSAQIAKRTGAKLVFVATESSRLPLVKSKQRDFIPTVCITNCQQTYRRLSIYWSVVPVLVESIDPKGLGSQIRDWALENGLQAGNRYITVMDTEIVLGAHDTVSVTEL